MRFYFLEDLVKHLQARLTMAMQRDDMRKFVNGSSNNTAYDKRMEMKLDWLSKNRKELIHHFLSKEEKIDITNYDIEGVFILSTPTVYMYNSRYRIYLIGELEDLIRGNYKDPEIDYSIEKNGKELKEKIKYPFFDETFYLVTDAFDQ